MHSLTPSRWMTLFCLVSLPMLTGSARRAPLRYANPVTETMSAPPAQPDGATQARISATYSRLPLSFEANQGQTDPRVQFLSRSSSYSLFLTPAEVVLALRRRRDDREKQDTQVRRGKVDCPLSRADMDSALQIPHSTLRIPHSAVLRMKLIGANRQPQVSGLEPLPGKTNYFLGKDPKRWHTEVTTYGKVKYQDVYPGIDLIYYGRQQQLKYDLVVAPGADPRSIRFRVEA